MSPVTVLLVLTALESGELAKTNPEAFRLLGEIGEAFHPLLEPWTPPGPASDSTK